MKEKTTYQCAKNIFTDHDKSQTNEQEHFSRGLCKTLIIKLKISTLTWNQNNELTTPYQILLSKIETKKYRSNATIF